MLDNRRANGAEPVNPRDLLTITFPVSSHSAHATLEACHQAGRVYAQWAALSPEWRQDDETLPFGPPTFAMIQDALKA